MNGEFTTMNCSIDWGGPGEREAMSEITTADCIEFCDMKEIQLRDKMSQPLKIYRAIRAKLQAADAMAKALNLCTPETYDEHTVHEALTNYRKAGAA